MRYSAEGLTYPNALKLIQALKAANIQANITTGAVAIDLTSDQQETAKAICQKFNASLKPGFSTAQENVMLQSDAGWQAAQKAAHSQNLDP